MSLVRAAVAVALLLAVVLAGCSGPPGFESDKPSSGGGVGTGGGTGTGGDPDDEPGAPVVPRPARVAMLLGFDLVDCSGVENLGILDAEVVQAALPSGYEVLPADDLDGLPKAVVQYVWASCGALRTPSATVNDTVFGFVSVAIEPPADALAADEHWYRLRMLTQDDVLATLWTAAGYDVATSTYADTSVIAGSPIGGNGLEDRDVSLGGYRVRGALTIGAPDEPVRAAHYTEVASGRLEWSGSFHIDAFRPLLGTLEVAADDPFSDAWASSLDRANQRYLDDAAWTSNNLWLRAPAGTP